MMQDLLETWTAGVDAVRGEAAVRAALPGLHTAPNQIIAVGKAACDMARAAMAAYPECPVLIVTKHGHSDELPGTAQIIEAGHPIPDEASLRGGAALLDTVSRMGAQDHLLLLVSGGASAVAEVLPDNMSLADWQAQSEELIASGADIHAINAHRRTISRIKGGRLLSHFKGARVTTLAISDVEGDSLNVIGSGIGAAPEQHGFEFSAQIVASNAIARAAAAASATPQVQVNEECLYDDVEALAPKLAHTLLSGPSGLYVFGGEPTVVLPDHPGRGGRNQALALHLAREIAGQPGIDILVAGTDGTDGPTPDAGALVDGTTWDDGAAKALTNADAGTFLAGKSALITTGPTGTNVMDLVIALKREART